MSRLHRFLLPWLLLVGLSATLYAQPQTLRVQQNALLFDHVGVEEGIRTNGVWASLQDQQGFMWFGMTDGLYKYDGYVFTPYRYDPHDPTTLSGNHVTALYEDRDGMLWVGTYAGGLNRFDPSTETFSRYQHDPSDTTSFYGTDISAIIEDRDGVIWIGTREGLNRFNRQAEAFTHYRHDPDDPGSLRHNDVGDIVEDRAGNLWISTWGGRAQPFQSSNRGLYTLSA